MSVASSCVKGVCVCLLPREDNNHRPYVLRHGSLAMVSALLLTIKILTIGLIALTPATADLSTITVNRIIQLTNNERVKAGLKPLTTNSKLMAAAQMKGEDMLAHQYFAHISPSGVTPWFWMAKTGYTYQVAGENLAIDFTEAEDVVTAWMNSPSHKENLLRSDYQETGVAVVTGEFEGGISTIVVHEFGDPATKVSGDTAPSKPAPTPSPNPTTTPTPSSSPTPTPTPLPASTPASTPPSAPSAPRVPRISAPDGSTTTSNHLQLFIEGDANTSTHILVNSRIAGNVDLSSQGKAIYSLDISQIPNGDFTVQGYSTNSTHQESELSSLLHFAKDVTSPPLQSTELSFFLSPFTERQLISLHAPSTGNVAVHFAQAEKTVTGAAGEYISLPDFMNQGTVSVTDSSGTTKIVSHVDLAPHFASPSNKPVYTSSFAPAEFSALGRQITTYVLIVIAVLLTLAVLIRIRVQHPALITHASFVILLAAILLVV